MSFGDNPFDLNELLPEALRKMSPADWAAHDARVAAQRQQEGRHAAKVEFARRLALLRRRGVPRRFLRCLQEPLLATASRSALVRTSGQLFRVLAGAVGVGKTVAAVEWLSLHGGAAPLFMRIQRFESASRYDEVFRTRWEKATAIVLDDLGSEFADRRGNFLANFDELIAHCHGELVPVVITTNTDLQRFHERYPPRIISRLREDCRELWLAVPGPNLRQRPHRGKR